MRGKTMAVTALGVRNSAFGYYHFGMGERCFGYRDLEVWQVSMRLVEAIFQITQLLPDHQRFALVSQMQRAAISIPSNIAEGHAKRAGKDYLRHIRIAAGSLAELETQLELCVRLSMIGKAKIASAWQDAQRVGRMLTRLTQRLEQSPVLPKARHRTSNSD